MTQINYPPSLPPAARGDFAGIVRFILMKWLQKTDDMLPATVISYNRTTNRAMVQPLISVVTTSNTIVQRGAIASVPVYQYGAGGFVISCPVNPGDLGWIKANDRDISNFLTAFKNSTPQTGRLHTFENGMFFPDNMLNGTTIANSADLVIQNIAGTVNISVSQTGINITGTEQINVTAPTVDITASSAMTITCPTVTITGTLAVDGNITGNGISLNSHVHGGVQTGSGDTGGPIG